MIVSQHPSAPLQPMESPARPTRRADTINDLMHEITALQEAFLRNEYVQTERVNAIQQEIGQLQQSYSSLEPTLRSEREKLDSLLEQIMERANSARLQQEANMQQAGDLERQETERDNLQNREDAMESNHSNKMLELISLKNGLAASLTLGAVQLAYKKHLANQRQKATVAPTVFPRQNQNPTTSLLPVTVESKCGVQEITKIIDLTIYYPKNSWNTDGRGTLRSFIEEKCLKFFGDNHNVISRSTLAKLLAQFISDTVKGAIDRNARPQAISYEIFSVRFNITFLKNDTNDASYFYTTRHV